MKEIWIEGHTKFTENLKLPTLQDVTSGETNISNKCTTPWLTKWSMSLVQAPLWFCSFIMSPNYYSVNSLFLDPSLSEIRYCLRQSKAMRFSQSRMAILYYHAGLMKIWFVLSFSSKYHISSNWLTDINPASIIIYK